MIGKIKNKWNSSFTYQKILFIVGCASLLSLTVYIILLIGTGVALVDAGEALKEFNRLFGASNDSAASVLYKSALSVFFIGLGQMLLPLLFSTTCFIFAFLKIKPNATIQNMTIQSASAAAVAKTDSSALAVIEAKPIDKYTPSSNVRFTVPEKEVFSEWKSSVGYYKIPIEISDIIINEKLYCRVVDENHSGLFAGMTMICILHDTTHYEFVRNFGSNYCFDCFFLKSESNFSDKDLLKISIKFYIPKFTTIANKEIKNE